MYGSYTPGQAVYGGTAGGAMLKAWGIDAVLVDVMSQEFSLDAIILATFDKVFALDAIISASGLKVFGLDAVIIEENRSNLPRYRSVGNGMSLPTNLGGLATWSTNNRPTNPSHGTAGINTQTGMIEWYDQASTSWKDYGGNSA